MSFKTLGPSTASSTHTLTRLTSPCGGSVYTFGRNNFFFRKVEVQGSRGAEKRNFVSFPPALKAPHPPGGHKDEYLLMRVQYGEHFCPNVISCKSFPRGHFEKLMDVNHTPLPVVNCEF